LEPGPAGSRERWAVRAIDPGRKEYAVFEGAPVVGYDRVFIAATRFEGDKAITAIHCYPSDPETSSPVPLWRADACEARELPPPRAGKHDGAPAAPPARRRHHLLTLARGLVVHCSHSGAITAFDARTGQRRWAVRYPRREVREPEDDPELRDLTPAL